jgi:hypothetical protein
MRISRQPFPIQIMTEQKQQENVECFRYLDSTITDDTRCTQEIKFRIVMAKSAFKKTFHRQIGFKFKEQNVKCYIWYDAESWTLQKINQKCLERCEM